MISRLKALILHHFTASSVMIKLAACNVGGQGRSSKKPVSKQTLLIEILSQMSCVNFQGLIRTFYSSNSIKF